MLCSKQTKKYNKYKNHNIKKNQNKWNNTTIKWWNDFGWRNDANDTIHKYIANKFKKIYIIKI